MIILLSLVIVNLIIGH